MISGWVCTVLGNDTMDKHFICALALKMIIDDLHRISCGLIDVLLALCRRAIGSAEMLSGEKSIWNDVQV